MAYSRRDFLRAMLLTSGAATFGGIPIAGLSQLAMANPLQPGAPDRRRRFIFCYFTGGWDMLLGLDPRDPTIYTDERRGETAVQPGYDRLPAEFSTAGTEGNGLFRDIQRGIDLGPAAAPIWDWRHRMCVVRGVSMDTVTHEVGRRYFITGRVPAGLVAKGSSVATEIAAQLHGSDAPDTMPFVPNLAYRVESYNDRHPPSNSALSISSVEDLLRTLRRPSSYSAIEEQLIADYLRKPRSMRLPESALPLLLEKARDSQQVAEAVLAAELDKRFAFPDGLDLRSPEAIGMLAVQALTNNVCTVVSISVAGNLDTHFDNWETDQPINQSGGFNVISRVLADLESTAYPDGSGDSWLDHTTVVAFSEFSRTPLINPRDGRDHHPTNVCALFGAGVPQGRVVGASTEIGMLPQPLDLETGVPALDGQLLRPEDILATVMAGAGLDGSILGRDVRHVPALAI